MFARLNSFPSIRTAIGGAPLLILVGAVLAAVCVLPLGQAVELGADEGFELAKAFLRYQGFRLYSEIWSDQPPLLTECLNALFRAAGPSILAARILTVAFSVTLLLTLYDAVRGRSGRWAAWSAVVLLLSAPLFLSLSVSVMQEMPAFALGMASLWALVRWSEKRRLFYLILSGALLAAALMIKFTAGLLIPAALGEIALASSPLRKRPRIFLLNVFQWGAAVMAVSVVLGSLLGFGGFAMLIAPHVQAEAIPGASKPSDFAFPVPLLLGHWEVWLSATVALIVITSKKLWREAAVPAVLFLTVTLVHCLHRPWWYCYYLHHAIPLAWLSAIAVREVGQEVWNAARKADRLRLRTVMAAVLLTALAVQSGTRLMAEIDKIRSKGQAGTDAMLAHINNYREQTHWIYAQPVIYAFHARLRVPPELAVVALKRYWSGQMTWQQLLTLVQKYRPEQMLLFKSTMGPEWTDFLKSNYVIDYDDGQKVLYIAKSLKTASP
jgi:hypothetical protein